MDRAPSQRAVREYARALLDQALPKGVLQQQCAELLGSPGFILSETPQCGLAPGVLLCFEMLSPGGWSKAVPAAIALDFTNCAIELFDKFLDSESLGVEVDPMARPQYLNIASSLQSLAHRAIDDLEKLELSKEKILECHKTIAGIVVETNDAQAKDLLAEGQWLDFDEALALATGKGAPLAGGIGALSAPLASDDSETIDACVKFFREAGAYSQVVNDLNDAMPGATHKSDVRKRKSTLPLVYFMSLTNNDHEKARDLLRSDTPLSSEEEDLIRSALETSGALDFTAAVAEALRLKARKTLLPLGSRFNISPVLQAFLAWR